MRLGIRKYMQHRSQQSPCKETSAKVQCAELGADDVANAHVCGAYTRESSRSIPPSSFEDRCR
ncbi:MAG: hypothetical protein MZV64_71815 [Ignavibacteriales bacterium]|nr:hypothetical protein [Ignavibacteriales bacterium]